MEININSPIFEDLLQNLNIAILKCVKEIHDGKFESGDISAKISIEFARDFVENETKGSDNTNRGREYLRPDINHKVTLTLKEKIKADGGYSANKALEKNEDGRFILADL